MTRAGFESVATALMVAALSLCAMFGGASLLRLSLAETHGAGSDALRPLLEDRIVGSAAGLDLSIAETATAAPAARARDLEVLLARAPASAGAWLDLAIARRAAGDDFSRVVEALRFSAHTGPREARLMAGRVAFALPFWAALPDDLKARLISDLAGVAPYLEASERDQVAALIEVQAPADIEQICGELSRREIADAAAFGCEAMPRNKQPSLRAKRSNPALGQGASASGAASPVAQVRGAAQRRRRGEAGLLRFARNDGKGFSHVGNLLLVEAPCAA